MTDYTPTTEEVRSYFMGSSFSRGEQFDRWLAEVKAQAWEEGYFEDHNMTPSARRIMNKMLNPYRQGKAQ